jgi:hypothetical protein
MIGCSPVSSKFTPPEGNPVYQERAIFGMPGQKRFLYGQGEYKANTLCYALVERTANRYDPTHRAPN